MTTSTRNSRRIGSIIKRKKIIHKKKPPLHQQPSTELNNIFNNTKFKGFKKRNKHVPTTANIYSTSNNQLSVSKYSPSLLSLHNSLYVFNTIVRSGSLLKFDHVWHILHFQLLSQFQIYCLVVDHNEMTKNIILYKNNNNNNNANITLPTTFAKIAINSNSFVHLYGNVNWYLHWRPL
ncbi:hypothetical protein Kpol_1043p74 [Vanderwaltozyma polyspora DSM 70294]|uniref:Uncharacterized protein n=1 Tax=Vanderwaltozyma polyspora (strain ATCC 22028 / DSM 70294 / BCRC 21397 / CBS 2163 / NBRC 10782 / NRRL Y-8283 / UCD 57-17) TaxID=436907 RepID=A7TIU1_VANPO|nr:uncharacterized protein Kpol_1043p74 [Vanderwaltozyma polyspora DSM 70294]EDO17883.1 hypothetical protein Kpol_1043p74 [Vanderwaltozyma polyspora DSM 70294]